MPSVRQSDVTTPHLRLPLTYGSRGAPLVNEQDSSEDIIDCVKAVIAFPIGSRQDMVTFGIPDLLFQQGGGSIPVQIKNAITAWEDRAPFDVSGGPLVSDELLWRILIRTGVRDG